MRGGGESELYIEWVKIKKQVRDCDGISFLREWSDLDALKGENLSNCGRWCLVLGFIQGFGFGLILWGGCGEIGDLKT